MSFIDSVRISCEGRDRLLAVKRKNGIANWNILCRWALCLSLADERAPSANINISTDSNIEMSWRTFSGPGHEGVYEGLVRMRCIADGIAPSQENMVHQFKLHLHRGIGYLAALQKKDGVDTLISAAIADSSLNPQGDGGE